MSIYQLMVSLNLPHNSLKSYLDQLEGSKLIAIKVEEARKTITTTEEGIKTVSLYRDAISRLKRH